VKVQSYFWNKNNELVWRLTNDDNLRLEV